MNSKQAETNPNNRKRLILAALSYLVSGLLIAWIISRFDFSLFKQVLDKSDPALLALAACLILLVPFFTACRWLGVVRAQSKEHIPYTLALRACMAANVMNSFLPSKAGDMAKVIYVRKRLGLVSGIGTVIVERMSDLFMMGILGLIGYFYSGKSSGLIVGVLLLAFVLGIFLTAFFIPFEKLPLPSSIQNALKSIRSVAVKWISSPANVLLTTGGALGTWILMGSTLCTLEAAIAANPQPGATLAAYPVAVLAGMLPVTVSGIGTRDAAFVALLSSHMLIEEAGFIALSYTVLAYWFIAAVSTPFVLNEIRRFIKLPRDTNQ